MNEIKFISALLSVSDDTFIKILSKLDISYFDDVKAKYAFKKINDYYKEYGKNPKESILVELDNNDISIIQIDEEYFTNQAFDFIFKKSLMNALSKSIEFVSEGNYNIVEKTIGKALDISIDTDIGLSFDLNELTETLIEDIFDKSEQTISTGWCNLDCALGDGVNKPSLNYILAKSGGGKCLGYNTKIRVKISDDLINSLKLKIE